MLYYFSFCVVGCISICAFASLLGIHIGTTSSDIDLKLCAITAENCKSIIKKVKRSMIKYC